MALPPPGADASDAQVRAWQEALCAPGAAHEPQRVAAAWRLGGWAYGSAERARALIARLNALGVLQRRAGLQTVEAMGRVAVPALLAVPSLGDGPFAVCALGRVLHGTAWATEAGAVAGAAMTGAVAVGTTRGEEGTVPEAGAVTGAGALLDSAGHRIQQLCASPDLSVQLCAVEALGYVLRPESAGALLRVAASDCAGDVRAAACLGLLQQLNAGALDAELPATRAKLLKLQESESHRYVAAYAAEGVHQIDRRLREGGALEAATGPMALRPPGAKRTLVRWCSHGDGWQVTEGVTEEEGPVPALVLPDRVKLRTND